MKTIAACAYFTFSQTFLLSLIYLQVVIKFLRSGHLFTMKHINHDVIMHMPDVMDDTSERINIFHMCVNKSLVSGAKTFELICISDYQAHGLQVFQ